MFVQRQDPFGRLDDMQRQMERFLNHVHGSKRQAFLFSSPTWQPLVDVRETADQILVLAELAGVKQESLDIHIDGKLLTIRGERQDPVCEPSQTYHVLEIHVGAFERVLALPVPVDSTRTEATYADGFLRISLPKLREQRLTQITIKDSVSE